MTGQCIEKLPHSCGTSDGLQVFLSNDGKFTGYCFVCDTYVPDPYNGKSPDPEEVAPKRDLEDELAEIAPLRSRDLPDRKLRAATLEYFGIKVGLSEQDGITPVMHFYPYGEKAYKVRFVPAKKFWTLGNIKSAKLFGWDQAIKTGAKRLYVTEGELDACALFQALKDKQVGTKYAEYNPAVVSLKSGASAAKNELAAHASDIRKHFQEVVLVFDNDEPGKRAVEEAMSSIPHARSVSLPCKDANACLIEGHGMAMANLALFRADKPKNTRIVQADEVIADARKQAARGLSWPWDGLTKLTKGIRWGETIYLGAGVKMGKSTVVSTLIAHMIVEHKLKCFAVLPEETNVQSFRQIVGKVAKRVFTDPDIEFDYDAYDKTAPIVAENLYLLNLYQNLDWNTLRGDIIEAVEQGCRVIFIDPITNITNGIDPAQANTVLQEFAQELAALAKDLNIIVFLFCHLKAPDAGPPHERGGKVFSSQFAGSRAMMRSCHLMLGLEGNKDPDIDENLRNMRRLVILEDRAFGASGRVNLFYDRNTGLLSEVKET